MDISKFLPLLNRNKAPNGNPPAGAEAEFDPALDQLDAMRGEIQANINALSARRQAMLLDPAVSSADIVVLDHQLAALRVDLERADELETSLLARFREAHIAQQVDTIHDLASRYQSALEAFIKTFRKTISARMALVDLRAEAVARGFEKSLGYLEIPGEFGIGLTEDFISTFEAGARQRLLSLGTPPPATAPLYVLEFGTAWSGFRAGERAGFSATEAHAIVAAGKATFVDRRLAPPAPAVKRS